MLPQTNLQLYRVMIAVGASEVALTQVRAAYDLARRLFVGCYRPSHKPFICHLVGAAGALATWKQRPDLIAAGLLHSAYMFGDFREGTRGVTSAKRRFVKKHVGAGAEALVAKYSEHSWNQSLDECLAAARNGTCDSDALLLKLADLCDECLDSGPLFSPVKPLEYNLPHDAAAREMAAELAGVLAGPAARSHLAVVLETSCRTAVPAALVTADRSFHRFVAAADDLARPRIRLRLRRFAAALGRKRAA
jgi:hypothetical protein